MSNISEKIFTHYRTKLRAKAIIKAKARIALVGKKAADFNEDELEQIVYEEEKKIEANIKNLTFAGLLLALGIG